jgi:hypothetical protein
MFSYPFGWLLDFQVFAPSEKEPSCDLALLSTSISGCSFLVSSHCSGLSTHQVLPTAATSSMLKNRQKTTFWLHRPTYMCINLQGGRETIICLCHDTVSVVILYGLQQAPTIYTWPQFLLWSLFTSHFVKTRHVWYKQSRLLLSGLTYKLEIPTRYFRDISRKVLKKSVQKI